MSEISDHSFIPRINPDDCFVNSEKASGFMVTSVPTNPALCAICRLAEAAHTTTTVER